MPRVFLLIGMLLGLTPAAAWSERAPLPKRIDLQAGQMHALTVPGLEGVQLSARGVVEVLAVGQQVLLTGVYAGDVTVRVQDDEGGHHSVQVRVTGGEEAPQRIRIQVGEEHVLAVPGVHQVTIADRSMAVVRVTPQRKFGISGMKPGVTTLRAMRGTQEVVIALEIVGASAPEAAADFTARAPAGAGR